TRSSATAVLVIVITGRGRSRHDPLALVHPGIARDALGGSGIGEGEGSGGLPSSIPSSGRSVCGMSTPESALTKNTTYATTSIRLPRSPQQCVHSISRVASPDGALFAPTAAAPGATLGDDSPMTMSRRCSA